MSAYAAPLPEKLFQEVLQNWERDKQALARTELIGNQAFIPPYIVSRMLHGDMTHVLIVNGEGKSWYDFPVCCTYEYDILTQLGVVRPGHVVFDVGANQGILTMLLARIVGEKGHVHAFDPFPINAALIRLNAKLNGLSDRITVHEVGASSSAKTLPVSLRNQCVGMVDEYDPIEIKLRPLDDFLHLKPDVIKLDIEGAEYDAIVGMPKLLQTRPNLFIEIHPTFLKHFGRTSADVVNLLPFLDYPNRWLHGGKKGIGTFDSVDELSENQSYLYLAREDGSRRTYLKAA